MALDPSDGWLYYKQINISDVSEVSADYQMKITIYKGEGNDSTAAGEIYCDNKCKDFHDDIRFGTTKDPDTATQLNQWVESSDTNSAVIWVKCPTDGSNTFYMFVGRATTDEFSDGDNTFIFFDDFLGDSLDTDKWSGTGIGDCSVANSILTFDREGVASTTYIETSAMSRPVSMRAYDKVTRGVGGANYIYVGFYDTAIPTLTMEQEVAGSQYVADYATAYKRTASAIDLLDWHSYENKWKSGESKHYQNDSLTATHTTQVPTVADMPLAIHVYRGKIEVDWIFVKKYTTGTEPSWSSFGDWTGIVVKIPKAGVTVRKIGLPTPINVGVGM